ncbi:hypothetical protein FOA52_015808 [Chlamydomonas sp. UWO 241]|nr:hypothetical protein FOA52_015808 [Chlamydomonas sp. UWO 241]
MLSSTLPQRRLIPHARRRKVLHGIALAVALGVGAFLILPKLAHVGELHAVHGGIAGFRMDSLLGMVTSSPSASTPPARPPPPVRGSCARMLSKELLEKYAVNGTVMITFSDAGMWNLFGATWLANLKTAGINYFVLAVADDKAAALVETAGVSQCFITHDIEVDDLGADFKWGSITWKLHTWQKVLTVRHVHQMGFHVLSSDLDVVWFRDPLSYFTEQYTEADYMVSMDPITTHNPIGDPGPETGVTVSHYMNTGVYFLRNTEGGSALINKWHSIRKEMQLKGMHDQDGLYAYLTRVDKEKIDAPNRITRVVDGGKTKLAQLPATQFQNGYSHCVNKIHNVHKLEPYEAHFVWVWGNNNGKMHRMREHTYFERR